jgi:hypothetical protein
MSRVTHFEISANNPEQMIDFYSSVFGWKITKWEGPVEYWLVSTGEQESPGIDGGIFKPGEMFIGTVISVDVDDIDAVIDKVKKAGGQLLVEKNTIPGIGYQAYCKDVEGTIIGLHQSDPDAV